MRNIKALIGLLMFSMVLINSAPTEVLAASPTLNETQAVERLEVTVTGSTELPEVVPYATTFVEASISVGFSSEGMDIDILTAMNGIASVVGVKDIEIQRKSGWFSWETVAVASGGEAYNCISAACTLFYAGAIEGETYRVKCVHYGDVDGYREMESQTSGYKYQY